MQQLEILVVRVRLRVDNTHGANKGAMTWEALPDQAKGEVVKHVAEMFHAHLERRAAGEVDDE